MVLAFENLPYWIFLGAGVLLFGFVILSGGGDDDLDADMDADVDTTFDVDTDIDADIDADAGPVDFDADADVSGDNGFSPFHILGWLGVGKAPLVLLLALDLCLWGLLGWMLNVATGNLLGQIPTGWLGVPILLLSLVAALLMGGQVARPIGLVFASFGESASSDRLVGCVGIVSSARLYRVSEGKIAQIDVVDPAKNLVTVNAALPLWATVTPRRGEQVLVIDRAEEVYLYYVVAKDSPDQNRWLNSLSRSKPSH
ncbi:MAG: DUF1449 domain-containing protein [Elainellaceae cyanobacterium]